MCWEGHTFKAAEIWAAGDAPSRGIRIPYECPENTVVCNGNDVPSWYRLSNVFGHHTVEWPMSAKKPPVLSCAHVQKPIEHNCTCYSGFIYAGRYGRWEKGVLSHTAYVDAFAAVAAAVVGER